MGELPARFGKYVLLRRVATGGMAEVLLAVEDTGHAGHRFVTIKRIKPQFLNDQDYVEFFLTEGRVSLKCAHANLPQTYELGVEGGNHYLAMEYIQGHTLLDVIRAAAIGHRPLSLATAFRVGVSMAAALEYVHGMLDIDGSPLKVIHRDVTPQNIMVTTSGTVKLIDFGIVRSELQTHQTECGVVKGKFSYMAPEMLAGKRPIDHRGDIFSLGIVLHELLTGRSLFRGKTDEQTLERVKTLVIPDVSVIRKDVPFALSAVILKALERDPDRRYQSATELLSALESAAETCNIHSSVTKIRDEVIECCGVPPAPSIDESALVFLQRPLETNHRDLIPTIPPPIPPQPVGMNARSTMEPIVPLEVHSRATVQPPPLFFTPSPPALPHPRSPEGAPRITQPPPPPQPMGEWQSANATDPSPTPTMFAEVTGNPMLQNEVEDSDHSRQTLQPYDTPAAHMQLAYDADLVYYLRKAGALGPAANDDFVSIEITK